MLQKEEMAARSADSAEMRKGMAFGFGCYVMWGLFPLYWYPLHQAMAADQLLAQRIVWSSVFAVGMLLYAKQGGALLRAAKQPRVLGVFAASALTLSLNWLVYLWAVTNNHVLDASLGYFMSPLVSVALGRIFLGETLTPVKTVAIASIVVGVLWLALPAGRIPWVALLLSLTFGFYSLLRKKAPLPALPALALETLLMLPVAALYLLIHKWQGTLVFSELTAFQQFIIIGSGVATTLPLLMFAAAARRISLTNLGMIQYVSPTVQFFLGLVLFHEAFSISRLIGYGWVWLGLLIFILGSWHHYYRSRQL